MKEGEIMRFFSFSLFFIFIFLQFGQAINPVHNLQIPEIITAADTVAKAPDYKGVNVVVETEWSDPEKINKVDVYVEYEKNQPNKLLLQGENRKCEIILISGMDVKIIDPASGKLLKIFKLPEEPPKKK